MRILVISDSHGMDELVMAVYNHELKNGLDCVLHLGDIGAGYENLKAKINCRMLMVPGNCDYGTTLPQTIVTELGGHKVFMAHGHRYIFGSDTSNLEYAALQNGCDIALFGHTHVPYKCMKDDIFVLNPGSIAIPRQAGYDRTYAIMEIADDGSIKAEFKIWK